MNNPNENVSMALFCDFENVALGVRDTKHQKFDIRPVLERLLLKGNIVVKKAYCDWERYKDFKATMHEANFELIEIPHVRQSGKNSADIRLVVDALDFCYTKSHVNTFVILSGDSDFSPLVSKLRENNKKVIGVGVKQSTSDLLVANCDEFIFYDDIAREGQNKSDSRRDNRGQSNNAQQRRTPEEERRRKDELEARRTKAVEMVVETFEALVAERGDSGTIWASVLKEALKRRRPDFNESYFGFRAFGNVLEEAQSRGFFEVGRAENSSTYVYRSGAGVSSSTAAAKSSSSAGAENANRATAAATAKPLVGAGQEDASKATAEDTRSRSTRGQRGRRKSATNRAETAQHAESPGYGEGAVADAGLPAMAETGVPQAGHAHDEANASQIKPTRDSNASPSPSAVESAGVETAGSVSESPAEQDTFASPEVKRNRARTRRTSKTAKTPEAVTPDTSVTEAAAPKKSTRAASTNQADKANSETPEKPAKKTTRSATTRIRRSRKTASAES